jgi:hypothetical protein
VQASRSGASSGSDPREGRRSTQAQWIIRDYEEASQNSGRTVQAIVADLEAVGHITRDRPDDEPCQTVSHDS